MDVGNGVVNYHRRIMEVSVERIDATDSSYDMCALVIKGKAFLWHQIRCIVAILFRVASKKESPEIVKQLLDIEENPRRPQYLMASEFPLNLSHCEYKPELSWHHDTEAIMLKMDNSHNSITFFASFCPITYLSNSETISLGDKEETTDLFSKFFSLDIFFFGNEVMFDLFFIKLNFF